MNKEIYEMLSRYVVLDIQHFLSDLDWCDNDYHRGQFNIFLRTLNLVFWNKGIVFKSGIEVRRGRDWFKVEVQKYKDPLDWWKGTEDLFVIYSNDIIIKKLSRGEEEQE